MTCPDRLSQWTTEVSTAFAHLSKPQLWGLVLWSAGIALSGVAGITQISALLAFVLAEQEQTVFQRLREWYLDAGQKKTLLAKGISGKGYKRVEYEEEVPRKARRSQSKGEKQCPFSLKRFPPFPKKRLVWLVLFFHQATGICN